MPFGQPQNQELGPTGGENEPSIEGQTSVWNQTNTRVRNIEDVIPGIQTGGMGSSLTGERPQETTKEDLVMNRFRKKYTKKQSEPRDFVAAEETDNEPPKKKQAKVIQEVINEDRTAATNKISGAQQTDSQEEVQRKEEKFQRALERLKEELGLDPNKDPLPQLSDKLKEDKVNNTTQNRDKIRSILHVGFESYSEQEIDEILARFENEETQQFIESVRVGEWMLRMNNDDSTLFGDLMQAKDMNVFINEHQQESAVLRAFIQDQQRVDELNEEYQEVVQLKQTEPTLYKTIPNALRVATAALLAKSGVSADVLNQLPPAGVAAVENVVKEGGTRVVGAMLANGVSVNDEEFRGRISGQNVLLDFTDQNLYLTGENAADRANQYLYPIDPPTPAGFEKILIHSVGEQNRMPFIANHNEQAQAMWERMVGDPGDESLPEEGNINRFRNFLVLLIGEGNPDESGEGKRLEKLGILTKGTSTVNRSRVDLFIQALEKFVPSGLVMHEGDSTATSGSESPSFDYEDALTLATLWDKDNRRMPESINELKDLTKRRQEGEDVTSRKFV